MAKALDVVDFQGYTARNLKNGRYVSSQEAGKLVKNKVVEIFKQKPNTSADAINTRFGINKTVNSAEESAKVYMENGIKPIVKKSGILKKALKFGLVGLGIVGLLGGGAYLVGKLLNKKEETPVNNVDPTPVKQQKQTKTNKIVPPVEPPKAEENQEDKKTEEKNNKYVVKKGDCLWNIAKAYLIEQHKDDPNYKPSNQEILDKTEELMKLNNKDYQKPLPEDSRKRNVLIVENEELNLT